MEIDKKQAKRKVKERDENGKKKKSREDKSEHNKKKGVHMISINSHYQYHF